MQYAQQHKSNNMIPHNKSVRPFICLCCYPDQAQDISQALDLTHGLCFHKLHQICVAQCIPKQLHLLQLSRQVSGAAAVQPSKEVLLWTSAAQCIDQRL